MAAKHLLQVRTHEGLYFNKFKRGGVGHKYPPWKPLSNHDTLQEALDARAEQGRAGFRSYRVRYKGKTLA